MAAAQLLAQKGLLPGLGTRPQLSAAPAGALGARAGQGRPRKPRALSWLGASGERPASGACRTASAEGPPAAVELSRRNCLAALSLGGSCLILPAPSEAARDRRPQNIPDDQFKMTSDGLKYYDFVTGKGEEAEAGKEVSVHFDCIYRTLTVISSRESKLLGGNRIIAQPYDFVVGSKPGIERKRDITDNANGMFSAQAAPKPPRAMYTAVEGMRIGGRRTVVVPPEKGYGDRGYAEIPPNATFTLNLELLEVKN